MFVLRRIMSLSPGLLLKLPKPPTYQFKPTVPMKTRTLRRLVVPGAAPLLGRGRAPPVATATWSRHSIMLPFHMPDQHDQLF